MTIWGPKDKKPDNDNSLERPLEQPIKMKWTACLARCGLVCVNRVSIAIAFVGWHTYTPPLLLASLLRLWKRVEIATMGYPMIVRNIFGKTGHCRVIGSVCEFSSPKEVP